MPNQGKKGLTIGPSTGWLYAADINDICVHERILTLVGASAVEPCLAVMEPRNLRITSLLQGTVLKGYDYKSLHLPDYNPSLSPERQIELAKRIAGRHDTKHALIHPSKANGSYPEEYYEALIKAEVPLAIENMDAVKKQKGLGGHDIRELEILAESCNLGFVFDTQHAYEHDSTMQSYAEEMFDMMVDSARLVHLHVSGEQRRNGEQVNNHSLVHESTNRDAITAFLQRNYASCPVPIILEGQSIGKREEDLETAKKLPLEERVAEAGRRLKAEIDFLTAALE